MDCKRANLVAGYLDRSWTGCKIGDRRSSPRVRACSQSYKDHQVLSEGLRTGSVYFKAPAYLEMRDSVARAPSGQSRVRSSMVVLVVG